MKLDVGQVVDRYTVDALIGAGGTAMVYRVRHNHLNTWHALKVLTITSEAIRERMLREGQVQASLRHLNIVTVTDVLSIDGAPGLLMEYIAGPSLERALGQFRLRMGDAETLFFGVVAGVRQAHEHGLVHRDLKPANVLLARTADGFVPKVTDFGLAKVLEDDPQVAHTRSGIAMGTPSYMAPEQIRDARTVDQRADLWSLGCILYELVTRTRAFPGDEALPIYNAVTGGDYVPPRDVVPDLPDRLDQAIRGCLTVDRERRLPDCETLLAVVQGRRTWQVDPAPPGFAIPSLPPSLPPDVPEMQVASRRSDGGTPKPAARRSERPVSTAGGLAVSESVAVETPPGAGEATIVRNVGVDGTLDASDSLVPPDLVEDDRSWVPIVILAGGAFVVGSVALLVALALVGSLVFSTRAEPPSEPAAAVAPATPPAAAAPSKPAPEPKVAPEPPPEPKVAREPKAPAPKPSPAPKAVAPPPDPVEPVEAVEAPVEELVAEPEAPTPPPAPQTVQVKLLSVPPTATLLVDGRAEGRTPAKLELLPGRHAVLLKSGDRDAEYVIDVHPNGENKFCYAFESGTNHEGACP